MSTLQEIENAISKLPQEDLVALRHWFVEFDAGQEAALKKAAWVEVNAFREGLAAGNRNFGDSTELVREDRER